MTSLTISLKRLSNLSDGELRAWNQLIELHRINQHAFLTPSYCFAVDRCFPSVFVILFRDGDTVIGCLPVQRGGGVLRLGRVYEPVGGAMTDYFGFIAAPAFNVQIGAALKAVGINAITFNHLDENQLKFGVAAAEPRVGLRTHISGTGKEFWENLKVLDKKLVSDTERRERKLISEYGDVAFELRSSKPDADLDELIHLKQSQYERTGKTAAPLFDKKNIALLRTLASCKDESCSGLLSTLRVNEVLVAAHFGLQCYDTLHDWFPVYAEKFHSYSPGRLLMKHLIHECVQGAGIRTFDRGEGDTKAKRDFANQEHQYYRGEWAQRGIAGVLGRGAISLNWRLEDLHRRFASDAVRVKAGQMLLPKPSHVDVNKAQYWTILLPRVL